MYLSQIWLATYMWEWTLFPEFNIGSRVRDICLQHPNFQTSRLEGVGINLFVFMSDCIFLYIKFYEQLLRSVFRCHKRGNKVIEIIFSLAKAFPLLS